MAARKKRKLTLEVEPEFPLAGTENEPSSSSRTKQQQSALQQSGGNKDSGGKLHEIGKNYALQQISKSCKSQQITKSGNSQQDQEQEAYSSKGAAALVALAGPLNGEQELSLETAMQTQQASHTVQAGGWQVTFRDGVLSAQKFCRLSQTVCEQPVWSTSVPGITTTSSSKNNNFAEKNNFEKTAARLGYSPEVRRAPADAVRMLAASERLIGLLFDSEFMLYCTKSGTVVAPRMTLNGLRLLAISVCADKFMVLAAGHKLHCWRYLPFFGLGGEEEVVEIISGTSSSSSGCRMTSSSGGGSGGNYGSSGNGTSSGNGGPQITRYFEQDIGHLGPLTQMGFREVPGASTVPCWRGRRGQEFVWSEE